MTNPSELSENDMFEYIVSFASSVLDVSQVGISKLDESDELLLASVGVQGVQMITPELAKAIDSSNDVFVNTNDVSASNNIGRFFMAIGIESRYGWLYLWVNDENERPATSRETTILVGLAKWIVYVLSTSSSITSRDAKRILNTQKQIHTKNRELAKADAQRKAMLENIGDGVVSIDDRGFVIYVNPAFEKLTGWTAKELAGKSFFQAFVLLDDKDNEIPVQDRPMRTALFENKRFTNSSYFLQRKDESRFAVSITATPVLLSGQVIGGVTVIRDISIEREVDKMKTEFISFASHQLKTPLSSIKWFTEMLIDGEAGDLSDEQYEIVDNIYQSNKNMIVLVNTLLNISRIESGRIIIEPKPMKLQVLTQEILHELDQRIKQKNHDVQVINGNSLPEVSLDPNLLRHVYLNLLTNAIKYTPNNGEISVRFETSGNELISVVRDDGMGIPEKDQEKIFSKFFRAENVSKIDIDGTGLGLYLTRIIVESMGGKIWFESEEGKGSSFTVVMPLSGVKPKEGEVKLS